MSIVERFLNRDGSEDGDRLELRLDDLYHLLSNSRRRFVVEYVGTMNEGESVTVDELARAIAYTENDVPDIEAVSGQQKKRVYVSLHQTHLKKLDDADLIRWDDQAQTVRPTADTETAWEVVRETNAKLSPEVPT